MRKKIEALIDQLIHLKNEGVTDVMCDAKTLKAVSSKIGAQEIKETKRQERAASLQIKLEDAPVVQDQKKEIAIKVEASSDFPEALEVQLPQGDKQTQWNWLKEKVLNCEVAQKELKPGKQIVFGVGSLDADIFFCGEAPGADEEIQGEPFVGKAGQLLTKIIQAMGLSREKVYISNIMNWRPSMPTPYGNRPPSQSEMDFCRPNLIAQLEIVKPKVIVALGATAVNGLLGPDSKRKMSDIRGKWQEFQGTPLMVTFHPSYLLRNNTMRTKRLVWEDMMLTMERVNLPISAKQRQFFS